jgi:hypothetical protein
MHRSPHTPVLALLASVAGALMVSLLLVGFTTSVIA